MATHGRTQLGAYPFNHRQSAAAEEEYDRLRNLARQEHAKMQSCFDRAHEAYTSGNGAEAHSLSEAGKQHQAQANAYNKQASGFIFRENNVDGRVESDTIDLHGQYVEEAEDILEQRIRVAVAQGQDHLHVIVGKGIHSPHHVQKIKPRVEQICQELGISYRTEENEGRMYLDLRGATGASRPTGAYGAYQQPHDAHQQSFQYSQQQNPLQGSTQQQPQYGNQQPQEPQQQMYYQNQAQRPPPQQFQNSEQQVQQDPLSACLKSCCTVM